MEGKSDAAALLMSKSVEVQRKVFHFDLKENSADQCLQISCNSRAGRFAISFPSSGISSFLDTFNSCMTCDKQEGFTGELHIENEVFYFHVGENRWGRFIKVSEGSGDRNQGSIIIPAVNSQNDGWEVFGRILAGIERTSRLLFPPKQQLMGLQDVSAGSISGHSGQSSSASQLNVEPVRDKIPIVGVSKVMRVGSKRFFFDLKGSNFLRISELMGANRSSIFVPLSELKQFHEMVGHFLEINNDSSEGLSVMDAKQSSSPPTGESSELDLVEKPCGSGEVD